MNIDKEKVAKYFNILKKGQCSREFYMALLLYFIDFFDFDPTEFTDEIVDKAYDMLDTKLEKEMFSL